MTMLIDGGADLNVTDSKGWTPVHKACISGHGSVMTVIAMLIDGGADVNAIDSFE
jgi:ankyrin repeat protein